MDGPPFRAFVKDAAVLEGVRRCAELGATVVYVGSWQPFYLGIGFEKLFRHVCWVKETRTEKRRPNKAPLSDVCWGVAQNTA